jgi:hypothetical protein
MIDRPRWLRSSQQEGQPGDLRRAGFALVLALLAEFVLGLAASLWVTIDRAKPWSHIGNGVLLAAHAIVGAAIAFMALLVLSRAAEAEARTRLWATVSLVAVFAALVCVFEFVSSGGASGWSFAMGLAWATALLANLRLAID